MHEMSLVLALLDIVEEHAARLGFSRVSSISLSFGALSGVDEKALRFAFEAASQDTRARGANLDIDIVPVVLECMGCGCRFEAEEFPEPCPECGSLETMIVSGTEEIKVISMDVDEVEEHVHCVSG